VTTASNLRTPVMIQQRSIGTDELGQPLNTWVNHVAVRADVRHVSGSETAKADALVSTVRASARVRRRADIKPTMRVLIGGTPYAITAVVPVEDGRQWMDIVCEVEA
jgi:SPP1 family predicted phage head-tail adaptor